MKHETLKYNDKDQVRRKTRKHGTDGGPKKAKEDGTQTTSKK